MKLKLDNTKSYAIALQGGGAKGGYEIGAWMALNEAGIRFSAVAGTSVGALNGAKMCMHDMEGAKECWRSMSLSRVFDMEPGSEDEIQALVKGEIHKENLREIAPQVKSIIMQRGMDVAPLRKWIREAIDPKKIRESDVDFYITTFNVSDRKGMDIKVNDLEEDEMIYDMLLASAYHPSFKLEPLWDGKLYIDGGFYDALPINPLIRAGYKDIIAVKIPGIGNFQPIENAYDVNLTYIETRKDLGRTLNFDSEQAAKDIQIGYLDTLRVLYGLCGKNYYIDRTLKEKDCLALLVSYYAASHKDKVKSLRELIESVIPAEALKLGEMRGDYHAILIALCENIAQKKNINPLALYSDSQFAEMCLS